MCFQSFIFNVEKILHPLTKRKAYLHFYLMAIHRGKNYCIARIKTAEKDNIWNGKTKGYFFIFQIIKSPIDFSQNWLFCSNVIFKKQKSKAWFNHHTFVPPKKCSTNPCLLPIIWYLTPNKTVKCIPAIISEDISCDIILNKLSQISYDGTPCKW